MFFLDRVSALRIVLEKSPYFEYLYRNAKQIGFKFEKECELLTLDYEKESVNIKTFDSGKKLEPELWVELDEAELIRFAEKGIALSRIVISTSDKGQLLDPAIDTILRRIFMPPTDKKYPLNDRVELIYGGMFGFQEPTIVWKSDKSQLLVIKYDNVFNGLDVYITAGFTNPTLEHSLIELEEGKISGYGYELMIFAESDDIVFHRELISWAKYIDDTGNHIYQGQYLEYNEGIIQGTNLAGFILLTPIEFPEVIPVSDGFGVLNLLIGVTEKELQVAKKQDIYDVADKLLENGYVNFTPANRESVF
ncbi:suppressor of fused domain protein [Clostridium sp. PL3]|uniref:Suppressor of fused domain protein n=1 Tax=Clostridium thailandense TaxID=2794346 RepID=A0A949X465_9CLOT|nr:suppressor of fused domain protein [Clostridium thailandense]MBV7275914.1 suppressor of fused domain protein [Clostridium thailandense]